MKWLWARISVPGWIAVGAVAMVLSPLLIGIEPVGSDPDLLYRPIKSELTRSLRSGTLPFWSDLFGVGVPLLAESHVAALYPPNILLYRVFGVSFAYRISMWLHFVALAIATYLYARRLGLAPWGAAMASVSFTLCGFQAIHAEHEPFYCVMPYLPLALLLGDLYAETGRAKWLALLALTWGTQLTLGHFQIQFWTGGLTLLVGTWRIVGDRRPWSRIVGLTLALAWGAAVAFAQLGPSWELTRIVGFQRPFKWLVNYSFPPAHWAQPALPAMFLGFRGGPNDPYWSSQMTTASEASLYVGTVTLILAIVGLVGGGRDRTLRPWRFVAAAGLVLALMPRLVPDGYWIVTRLPGLGWFRAPGRYMLLTCFGLSLIGGQALDPAIPRQRFRVGLCMAILFGVVATAATLSWWLHRADYRAELGKETLAIRLGLTALSWGAAILALIVWRRGAAGPGPSIPEQEQAVGRQIASSAPFAVAVIELSMLFYFSPTHWGWSVAFPTASPVAERLARETNVGLVAGAQDLPTRAGLTTAYPYLGITAPPPNYLLEPSSASHEPLATEARWMRRFGVTHAIRPAGSLDSRGKVIYQGPDPALDRLMPDRGPRPGVWQLVRLDGAFPPAWAATKAVVTDNWYSLYPKLSSADRHNEAWYTAEDRPPDGSGPRAQEAEVVSWDGRVAMVSHDGTCDLVLRRASYPGWLASIDDGPERPVGRACGGLQAVRLFGSGTTRVRFRHEPTNWRPALAISLTSTIAALLVVAVSFVEVPRWQGSKSIARQAKYKEGFVA